MKNVKRFGFAITTGAVIIMSTVSVFAGSNYKSVKHSKYNAYGTEFVSFIEGPLTFADKVGYTFAIAGPDQNKISIQYRAGTPSKRVAEGTLSSVYGLSTSGTNVSAGYGNSYAYAIMDVAGNTYEIHATD